MLSASAQLGCGGILASAVAVGRVHRGWAALCCEQGPSAGPPLGLLSASASRLLTDRDRTRFCCPRLRPHGHADSWAHAGPRVFLGAGVPLDKPGPRLSSFAPVPGPWDCRERAGRAAAAGLRCGGAAGTALSTTRVLCAAPSSTQTTRWAQASGPGQTPAPGPRGDCLLCFGLRACPGSQGPRSPSLSSS